MRWRDITQADFEALIDGDDAEQRHDLRVEQVTPVYDLWRQAVIRVLPGREARLREIHGQLSWRVQQFLSLRPGTELAERTDAVEQSALYVSVYQQTDRNAAGYANIYRGLKALAPCLEDARFFISELYDSFVDEYRFVRGALQFRRDDCGGEGPEALLRRWEEILGTCPEDHELRRFLARQHVHDGEYYAQMIARDAPGAREALGARAMAAFDAALAHDPGNARAWRQAGELHRLLGDPQAAARCLSEAMSLATGPEVQAEAALSAFAARRDADALAGLDGLASERRSRIAWQLLGHLHARARRRSRAAEAFTASQTVDPDDEARVPDAEALLRTGRADEVLASYFDWAIADLEREPAGRAALVRELVAWGDAHRHREPARAAALVDRAIELGDPDGDAHHARGLLHEQQGQRAEAEKLFEAALAINPRHLAARGKLGDLALARGDRKAGIAHLRAYLEHSSIATVGGHVRQQYASRLFNALYAEANHTLDVVRDFAAAEALFDETIALLPQLSLEMRRFSGGWVGKSNTRAWRRDHQGALECADRALELNPECGYAWSARGNALNNLRRFAEAMPCYEQAIAAEPKYWHPYYCKACTLALTGQDRQQIYALLTKAVQLAPERRAMLRDEPDFASLRGDPAFAAIVSANTTPAPNKQPRRPRQR